MTRATTTEELRAIVDSVHDRWFRVTDVTFDSDSSCVTIPFRAPDWKKATGAGSFLFWRRVAVPETLRRLRVLNAISLTVVDSEKVESYDFNTITFDPGTSILCIRTGVPLRLEVSVRSLDVRVEDSGEVVGHSRRTLWVLPGGGRQ